MVEVRNLSVRYGATLACSEVSFTVAPGSFTTLLGPNGAGKSTILGALSGVLIPAEGEVIVCGSSLSADPVAAKRRIGCVFEDSPLYGDMTVRNFLSFVASMFGMDNREARLAADRVIELCSLEESAGRRCSNLSKGTRQRVTLAQALVHDPSVLILDEPATGLDPVQAAEFQSILARIAPGKAIIYSTHVMNEISGLCTDAVIVDRGRMLASGTVARILSQTKTDSLEGAFLSIVAGGKDRRR